jgi:sulfonate transport system permease protein
LEVTLISISKASLEEKSIASRGWKSALMGLRIGSIGLELEKGKPVSVASPVRLADKPKVSWTRLSWPDISDQRWLSPLILLAAWEVASLLGWIPSRILAAPSAVLQTFWRLTVDAELPSALAVSLARMGVGLAIGVTTGSALALVAGLSKLGETLVDPPLQIIRPLPTLALTPLFIVWLGIGETPKIALIALGVTFPVYLNLFNAIRSVDPRLMEAGRSFGLRGWALIANVVLPGAMPGFLVGLRYALSVALLILVVAEQINASAGLGYLINNARDFMQTDVIVVCLLVYALLGLAADSFVRAIERRVLVWRPAFLKS